MVDSRTRDRETGLQCCTLSLGLDLHVFEPSRSTCAGKSGDTGLWMRAVLSGLSLAAGRVLAVGVVLGRGVHGCGRGEAFKPLAIVAGTTIRGYDSSSGRGIVLRVWTGPRNANQFRHAASVCRTCCEAPWRPARPAEGPNFAVLRQPAGRMQQSHEIPCGNALPGAPVCGTHSSHTRLGRATTERCRAALLPRRRADHFPFFRPFHGPRGWRCRGRPQSEHVRTPRACPRFHAPKTPVAKARRSCTCSSTGRSIASRRSIRRCFARPCATNGSAARHSPTGRSRASRCVITCDSVVELGLDYGYHPKLSGGARVWFRRFLEGQTTLGNRVANGAARERAGGLRRAQLASTTSIGAPR